MASPHDDAAYTSDFLAVRESGNVGIGTVSPESKLHVVGSARLDYGGSYIIENTVGNAVTVATVDAGNVLVIGGSNINAFQIGDNDAYIASTGAADSRQMVFYAGNAVEAARINASGYLQLKRLGVGTSPLAPLHVVGNGNQVFIDADGSGTNYGGYPFVLGRQVEMPPQRYGMAHIGLTALIIVDKRTARSARVVF